MAKQIKRFLVFLTFLILFAGLTHPSNIIFELMRNILFGYGLLNFLNYVFPGVI